MPYSNVPEHLWDEMDRCVDEVMKDGKDKESAIAICHTSIVEGKSLHAKDSELTCYKQADGKWRWILFSSSSYRDRDGEIVSQNALEQDTARMNVTKRFGTLDFWHEPRFVLGDCDFSAMHGRISIESGTFYDDVVGERIAAKAHELAASRAFYHPLTEPDAEGVYHHIETFARAILPRGKESNLLTRVSVSEKGENKMLDTVRKAFEQLVGKEKVEEILAAAEATDKAAEQAGLAYKAATETQAQTEPPNGTTAPTTKADGDASEQPAPESTEPVLVMDLKPDELRSLIMNAVKDALSGALEDTEKARASAAKAASDALVAEIGKVIASQAEIAQRLAALEGNVPRAYRATRDAGTTIKSEDAAKLAPAGDSRYPKTLDDTIMTLMRGVITPA